MNNNKDDIRLLKSRLEDMIELSEKNCMPVYSDFLDEKQASFLEKELSAMKFNRYMFYGGYENAQRKILCVYTEYYTPELSDFPVSIIEFSYRKSDILTHRDFLGAIMSCRVKREKIGDILVSEGIAQVMAYESVGSFLADEIKKIGRTGVKTSLTDKCTIEIIQKYLDIKGTVASLRLDCVVSLALGKSREKTVQIIKKYGVDLNFNAVFSPSVTIKENDVFSIRGFGKFRLNCVSGLSSKGRFHILIQKYI